LQKGNFRFIFNKFCNVNNPKGNLMKGIIVTILEFVGFKMKKKTEPPCGILCENAKKELADKRRALDVLCGAMKVIKIIIGLCNTLFSVNPIIPILLIMLGLILGGPLGFIAAVIIITYVVAFVVYFAMLKLSIGVGKAYGKAITKFQSALPEVISKCSEDCRGDISIPKCDVL